MKKLVDVLESSKGCSKMKESEEAPRMKWFRDGSVFKPNFFSEEGVDAVAVDSYIDKLVKEHDNRFEIKDPRIAEELYFEVKDWDTRGGDNVYVDILFNRDFDRDFDETKWGKKSYGATSEHGYVEDLLNNGGLEKLGIPDAKITSVGWDSSKHVPRWSIELFAFSVRNIDGTFKRPNTSDSWTSSHSINGTEPFTLEEGKEISKAVMDYIIELFKANPKRVYYKPSDAVTTVEIVDSRSRAYDPSWKGSYTHNTGWFGFSCYIEDAYDENAINWRGRQGATFRADEDTITELLQDKAAETLNDFLYDFNLEVVPAGCKASWYHGSEEDEANGVLFEVSIKFKEIGIDSDKSYFAHQGNSFKGYWPGSEPKDIYKGKTFKRNPKKIKESFEDDIGWAIKMPNKMYYGYTWTKDINNAAIFGTEQEARNEFRRINDGSKPFKLVKVDLGGCNGYEVLEEKPLRESKNLEERVMTAEEADFHEGDVYKNRYGWTIVIEELDGDYVHIKQYLDTKRDQVTTHMKLIPSLYEHLMNFHFTKIKNINESRKRFHVYDREINNQMDSILGKIGVSIKPQSVGQGYALYSIEKPNLQVGELMFTPAAYYLAGPRENIYWEGSTLEEFIADVDDMAYAVREVVKSLNEREEFDETELQEATEKLEEVSKLQKFVATTMLALGLGTTAAHAIDMNPKEVTAIEQSAKEMEKRADLDDALSVLSIAIGESLEQIEKIKKGDSNWVRDINPSKTKTKYVLGEKAIKYFQNKLQKEGYDKDTVDAALVLASLTYNFYFDGGTGDLFGKQWKDYRVKSFQEEHPNEKLAGIW